MTIIVLVIVTVALAVYLLNRAIWSLVWAASEAEDRERRRVGEEMARKMVAEYKASPLGKRMAAEREAADRKGDE